MNRIEMQKIKIGDKVGIIKDSIYLENPIGEVVKIGATRIDVKFGDKILQFNRRDGREWGRSKSYYYDVLCDAQTAEQGNDEKAKEVRYRKAHKGLTDLLEKNRRGGLSLRKLEQACELLGVEEPKP